MYDVILPKNEWNWYQPFFISSNIIWINLYNIISNRNSLFPTGYNCSLFAYGQTGSGKSYSMVGYGQNKFVLRPLVFAAHMIFFLNEVYYLKYMLTGNQFKIVLVQFSVEAIAAILLCMFIKSRLIYHRIENWYIFNRGIVPITCDEMFKTMDKNADPNKVGKYIKSNG